MDFVLSPIPPPLPTTLPSSEPNANQNNFQPLHQYTNTEDKNRSSKAVTPPPNYMIDFSENVRNQHELKL